MILYLTEFAAVLLVFALVGTQVFWLTAKTAKDLQLDLTPRAQQ